MQHLQLPPNLPLRQYLKNLIRQINTLPQTQLPNIRITLQNLRKLIVRNACPLEIQTLQPP